MIPALEKAIDSLFCPCRFSLSRQSRGQRSPLAVYTCSIGTNLVSAVRHTSLLLTCWTMHAKILALFSTCLQHDRWKIYLDTNIKASSCS